MSRSTDDGVAPIPGSRHRLEAITLDAGSIRRGNSQIEHEREVAIYDILDANEFALLARDDGPYKLHLAVVDDRLQFAVTGSADAAPVDVSVPLLPLRRVIKDYHLVCETYFDAVRTAPPSRIQQIDIGRRKLHDDGAAVLAEKLGGQIRMDTTTTRRLFTLVSALHWRG